MPAPKKILPSKDFEDIRRASDKIGEWNDCTVVAVALATNTPYETVHKMLADLGRVKGRGTSIANMKEVCLKLGYEMKAWSMQEYINMLHAYPKSWRATVITTHQPRRCPKAWAPLKDRRFIFHTARHVAAVIDAKVHDWSINNSLRVNTVYEVTKL